MSSLTKFNLGLSGSTWLLILAIIIGIVFTIYIYRWTNPPVARRIRLLLIALRMIALLTVIFIIFEPILALTWYKTQRPLIGVLIDTSGSMSLTDAGGSRPEEARKIMEQPVFDELTEENDVEYFRFSDKLEPLETLQLDSLRFTGDGTDIQNALQALREQSTDDYLCAVIVVSDGGDNLGDSPERYAADYGVPIYAIPVGDPAEQKDALISRVMTNEVTYAKNKVPLEVTIRSSGYQDMRIPVTLVQDDKILDTQTITLSGTTLQQKVTLHFIPEKEGIFKYQVNIPKLDSELTALNNSKSFYVKVLKSKMKILIIAGAPSPDFKFIQRALNSDETIEVDAYVERKNGQFYQGDLPSTVTQLSPYDCFVFLDYPRSESANSVLLDLKKAIDENDTPLFFISGNKVTFKKLEPFIGYLPFTSRISMIQEKLVFAKLAGQGVTHPMVRLSDDSHDNLSLWSGLPPVYYPYINIESTPGTQILVEVDRMRSRIPASLPAQPLIATRRAGAQKSAAFLGYGFWRWDFLMWGIGKDNQTFLRLLNNTIRWLVTKEDSKLIRIRADKEIYRGGESIGFSAQAYYEDYRPLDGAEISVMIRKGERQHKLNLTGIGDGKYEGQIQVLDGGDYSFEGTANFNNRNIGNDNGKFSVEPFNLEFQSTRMKAALLQQIASQSGGDVVPPDSLSQLSRNLVFPPKRLVQSREWELWNKLTLLFVAVACLALEWFIRKRKGML
ncbi:hypothetical protein JXJ21_16620 [candidate division KSB1 bacterium]|nr:hypothetical protein [candidate division KSB1 bacterium]